MGKNTASGGCGGGMTVCCPEWIGTSFQSIQDNRKSSKKNNKYQLYTYGCTS